jgi:hypothetical protein
LPDRRDLFVDALAQRAGRGRGRREQAEGTKKRP